MSASSFPRKGCSFVPRFLAPILTGTIPKKYRSILPGCEKFSDLGPGTWEHLPKPMINSLTLLIASAVRSQLPRIRKLHLPRIEFDADLEDLELENRTRGCLYRLRSEGSIRTIEDLASFTIEGILMTPNFGLHTLLDLLTFMESPRTREKKAHVTRSRKTYPRKTVESNVSTSVSLESEAEMNLRAYAPKTHYKFLAAWYGLDSKTAKNRRELGALFGVCAERAGGILLQFQRTIKQFAPDAPVLKKIVTILNESSLSSADDVWANLKRQGLTTGCVAVSSIIELAETFGINCHVSLVDSGGKPVLATPDDGRALRQLAEIVSSLARSQLAVSVEEAAVALDPAVSKGHVRVILECLDIEWLDEEHERFWLPSIGSRKVERQIRKILCNCAELAVDELVAGTLRLPKDQRANVPKDPRVLKQLIAKICQRMTEVKMGDDKVFLIGRLDPRNHLNETEQVIANTIRERGGRCSFNELRDECANAGIPTMRFCMAATHSPIFVRVSRGVYSLRGLTTVV